jgi:RHS repeat-associated protein
LGSATVALDGSGTPSASQLYTPYGGTRYGNGTMPTDYGFTGQRADATTGLDYYGARYYDPTVGQFTSADTVMDGLNRYGYVSDNPISRTDPSGHTAVDGGDPKCPSLWQTVCWILTAVSVGINILRGSGLKDAQATDATGTTETTTGSDNDGFRIQVKSRPDDIQLEDENGNPIPITGRRSKDDGSVPPKETWPNTKTTRGRAQTAKVNPGSIRGTHGNNGFKYQIAVENERMTSYEAQQNAWLTAKPTAGSNPSWAQIAWSVYQQTPEGQGFEQLGQWVGNWFKPPSTPVCAELARAGCIDPNNPFKSGKDDGKGDDIPIKSSEEIPVDP